MAEFTTLLDDLIFCEGPRWHGGKLWFSDMHDRKIWTVDLEGNKELVHEADNDISGLGFLPDGTLLYVSMQDRKLIRLVNGKSVEVADLSGLATFHCNDMIVDSKGRSYIGNFGFDLHGGETPSPANFIMVDEEGTASIAAPNLMFANGTVITPDNKTMIVGETFGACLTAFDIAEDGTLSNKRQWADISPAVPDGICLDADGAIWVASPTTSEVIRVLEGGEITHHLKPSAIPFACMLGSDDRKTLFVLTAEESSPHKMEGRRTGKIEITRVHVAGAGRP
jgi:sugar lactone lactonase YvrE